MSGKDKRVCSNLVLVFAIFFSLALITVHLTEPEVNFEAISLYSLGPFGLIMRIGFISLGLAFVSMMLSLWDRTRQGSLNYLDEVLFLISGIGLVLIGIFNTDSPNASPTLAGTVHSWSALTWSVSASLGILVFAPAFRQYGMSLNVRLLSRNLGIVALAVWSAGFLSYGTFFAPVQPRLFFSVVVIWISLVAVQLRSGRLSA